MSVLPGYQTEQPTRVIKYKAIISLVFCPLPAWVIAYCRLLPIAEYCLFCRMHDVLMNYRMDWN